MTREKRIAKLRYVADSCEMAQMVGHAGVLRQIAADLEAADKPPTTADSAQPIKLIRRSERDRVLYGLHHIYCQTAFMIGELEDEAKRADIIAHASTPEAIDGAVEAIHREIYGTPTKPALPPVDAAVDPIGVGTLTEKQAREACMRGAVVAAVGEKSLHWRFHGGHFEAACYADRDMWDKDDSVAAQHFTQGWPWRIVTPAPEPPVVKTGPGGSFTKDWPEGGC